jgi:hypothetical protein
MAKTTELVSTTDIELKDSEIIKRIDKFINKSDHKYTIESFKNFLTSILNYNYYNFAEKILEAYPGFVTSPASRSYHGNYEGGLLEHSLRVYEAAVKLHKDINKDIIVNPIACIFHDLCKVGLYIPYTSKDGKKGFNYDTSFESIQHGPESLKRLLNISIDCKGTYKISEAWQEAIAFHMSVFDVGQDERMKYTQACRNHPEVLLLHTADMVASTIYNI